MEKSEERLLPTPPTYPPNIKCDGHPPTTITLGNELLKARTRDTSLQIGICITHLKPFATRTEAQRGISKAYAPQIFLVNK